MADQVTISTFLELRDNMSEGLKRVADALQAATAKAPAAQAAITRMANAADRSARAQEAYDRRLTAAKFREEQRRIIQAERAERRRAAIMRRAQAESERALAAIARAEAHNTRVQIAELNRVEKARAAAHRQHMARIKAQKDLEAAKKGRDGLFGTMVSANIVSDLVTRGVSFAYNTVKNHIKEVIDASKEYEDSVNRIALSLTGLNISPSMRAATRESEGLFNVLRTMAAKLPGETQDYIQVFAQGLPDALTAGMTDTKKFAEFVSKYTAIAISRGVGAARAATDIEQILEGRARVTTRTYAELRPYIGMLSREFNKLSPVERFERLQQAVEKAATGIDYVAETASAKFGELESHIKEIYTIGEKPLFEAIKGTVSDINKLFVENRKHILDTARDLSTGLGDAIRGITPLLIDFGLKIAGIVNNISTFLDNYWWAMGPMGYTAKDMLDTYRQAKKSGELTREQEGRTKSLDILKKYQSLIIDPGTLSQNQLDQYLKELWVQRKGTKGGIPDGIQSQEDWDAFVTAMTGNADKAQELWKSMIASDDVQTTKMPHTAPDDRARTYNDFRGSSFNIKQEFAEGFDPDRIAVAFASDLNRVGEMKIQGAYGLAAGVR